MGLRSVQLGVSDNLVRVFRLKMNNSAFDRYSNSQLVMLLAPSTDREYQLVLSGSRQ